MALKWLITGGCGFIGVNLIRRLVQDDNNTIRVLDNLTVGTRSDLEKACDYIEVDVDNNWSSQSDVRCELVVGDILDKDIVARVTEDIDVIVHLAANTGVPLSIEDPVTDCSANVLGTLYVLEGARLNAVRRVVFASSGAPAGEVIPPIHEEIPPHPVSPYGASKLAGEAYCSAYKKSYGIDTVALRFSNVYGPYSSHKSSVVAKFIKSALDKDIWTVYGDGEQTRDYIYINDLVSAIEKSAHASNVGGEVFQIATGLETSINQLMTVIASVLDEMGIPTPETVYQNPRVGDVVRNYSDVSKARKMLEWSHHVALAEGVESTVRWFLEHYGKH